MHRCQVKLDYFKLIGLLIENTKVFDALTFNIKVGVTIEGYLHIIWATAPHDDGLREKENLIRYLTFLKDSIEYDCVTERARGLHIPKERTGKTNRSLVREYFVSSLLNS